MTKYDINRLAKILAVQAEIEGMKVENQCRDLSVSTQAYNEQDFGYKAELLRDLAGSSDVDMSQMQY